MGLRYSRVALETKQRIAVLHRSVGEPAEGSLPSVAGPPPGGVPPPILVYLYPVASAGPPACPAKILSGGPGRRGAPRPRARARRGLPLGTLSEGCSLSPFWKKIVKTFNNGSLGSGIDEERSEMR